jgi:hypothetical protein
VTKELVIIALTTNRLTLPLSAGNVLPSQYDCRHPPTLLFSGSPIEDKVERPPF